MQRVLALLLLSFLSLAGDAAERVWVGLVGVNMSDGANWAGGVPPAAGDRLIFPPPTEPGEDINNDLPGLVFDSMVAEGYPSTIGQPPPDFRFYKGAPFVLSNPQPLLVRGFAIFDAPVVAATDARIDLTADPGMVTIAFFGDVIGMGSSLRFARAGPPDSEVDLSIKKVVQPNASPALSVTFENIDFATITDGLLLDGAITVSGGKLFEPKGDPLLGRGTGITVIRGTTRLGPPGVLDVNETVLLGDQQLLWFAPQGGGGVMRGDITFEGQGRLFASGPMEMAGRLQGATVLTLEGGPFILTNPTSAWTGTLGVLGSALAVVSEVIPDANVLSVIGTYDQAAATETVRGLFCGSGGTIAMDVGAGLLNVGEFVLLDDCRLTLRIPAALDAHGRTEIPLVRYSGTWPISGRFTNALDGKVVLVNGVRMQVSYAGGASGRDIVLVPSARACVATPDFNGDCTADLLRVSAGGGALVDLIRDGQSASTIPHGGGVIVTHAADFNGDGRADLLGLGAGNAVMMTLDGSAPDAWVTILAGGTGWLPKLTGDFDGDGKADILWEHTDGSSALWTMNGVTQVSGRRLFGAGTGWVATHVADFNGDGRADILWRHADGSVAMWLLDGIVQVGGARLLPAATGWSPLLTGDFNGDGKADILWQHTDGASALWIMNGATQAGGGRLFPGGTGWFAKTLGDFNGDRKADIGWQHTDGRVAVWLMDGSTQAGGAAFAAPGAELVTARDVNDDGRADLVFEAPDGTLQLWWMNAAARAGTTTVPAIAGYKLLQK